MKKLIISAFLVISVFATSFVFSYAAAEDPSTGNGFTVIGTPHFVPYSGEVDSASALAAILAALTSSDQALDYQATYNSSWYVFMPNYTVNIKYNAANSCYGIYLSNQQFSGWLHTGNKTSGYFMVYCPEDKFEPNLLYAISRSNSSISGKVTSIASTLTNITQQLDDENLYLHSMLDSIVSEFVDLGSLISYNSTVVEALNQSLSSYASSIQASTANIETDVSAMKTVLSGISADVGTMLNRVQSMYNGVSNIDLNVEAILSKLDNLSVTAVSDFDDTDILSQLTNVNTNLGDLKVALGDLNVNPSFDDTDILSQLTNINTNFGDLKVALGDLNVTTDFSDTGIVSAINKLTDSFSLGETKTLEIQANGYTNFNYADLGSIQSVRISGTDDSGFVIFGVGGSSLDFTTTIAECDSGTVPASGYFWTVNAPTNTLTITVPSHPASALFSRVPAGTYTVSLLDASGSLISLDAGDKLRPSSTMSRWEVLRTDGSVVGIAGCSGLPDGCDFADIAPRCARVLVRDLVAAPSLLTSYADAFSYDIGDGNFYSFFQLINTSGAALTVEYVTPSPLLNWYANRQDDFRYWLDTRLSGLPVSKSADLTAVTSRLDTIIEELQSSGGELSCEHTYSQEMTQAPTCILPGLQVSTCSKCGSSYSEIVAALGHDWQCTDHVEDVTDPDTGEVTETGYDIYTCSRCSDTYNDYSGSGAPSDYGDTSISKIIVSLFSKLGTFAGKILSWIIGLFDKLLGGLDDLITRFSELTAQITGFGGDYPTWLSGFWGILPRELQLALGFSFVCLFVGLIGRKLFFV